MVCWSVGLLVVCCLLFAVGLLFVVRSWSCVVVAPFVICRLSFVVNRLSSNIFRCLLIRV